MGKIIRNLKSFSGAMIATVIVLIAAFFILNWVAKRGIPVVSTVAGWTEAHATGQAYAAAAPVVGVPSSSSYGPQI
jgi:phosphoribosylcarboxyaminoimidazole (NCAIR) mutase